MKKSVLYIAVLVTFLLNLRPAYAEPLDLDSQSYILIDAKSGQVLYEQDAGKKLYPASTTKILTGVLALEMGNPDQLMTASRAAVNDIGVDGMNIGISTGEELRMEDLVNALLIRSANETANILAENLSPTRKDFVDLMNAKAKELGCTGTNFANPCGAHDPNHYTTAGDMAKIARYAMANPKFREIIAKRDYAMAPTNKHAKWDTLLYTTNKLFENRFKSDLYSLLGGKTGYTSQAGNNLVSFAVNPGGMELISVVMSVKSPAADIVFANSRKLLEYGFENYALHKVAQKNQAIATLPVANAVNSASVELVVSNDIECVLPVDKNNWNIETKQYIVPYIGAPLQQGDELGWIEYERDGVSLGKAKLLAASSIERSTAAKAADSARQAASSPLLKRVALIAFIVLVSFLVLRTILRRISRMVNGRRQEE